MIRKGNLQILGSSVPLLQWKEEKEGQKKGKGRERREKCSLLCWRSLWAVTDFGERLRFKSQLCYPSLYDLRQVP